MRRGSEPNLPFTNKREARPRRRQQEDASVLHPLRRSRTWRWARDHERGPAPRCARRRDRRGALPRTRFGAPRCSEAGCACVRVHSLSTWLISLVNSSFVCWVGVGVTGVVSVVLFGVNGKLVDQVRFCFDRAHQAYCTTHIFKNKRYFVFLYLFVPLLFL